MKGKSAMVTMVAASLLTAPYAGGQSTAREEMRSAQFFVGIWNCAHTVGDFSGTYKTTIANALEDRWLKQTYEFPGTSEGTPVRAEFYIGYDGRKKEWVWFGAMSDGLYFVMVAKRAGDSWAWTCVLPGQRGSAVYTKRSDSQYTVDGPTYMQNGKQVTEHHTCTKLL